MIDGNPFLVLRIPRTSGATRMSAVLVSGEFVYEAQGAGIAEVCDTLAGRLSVQERITLVFPLDGRHAPAHVALEEANRRGWSFSRHVPSGHETLLLDLDSPDAVPELTPEQVSVHLNELATAIRGSIEESELGEALSIARQSLTVCLRHLGAWHPDTFWSVSNLLRIAAGTGADENVEEACGLIAYLIRQPTPEIFDNPTGLLRKLDEVAKLCAQDQRTELADRVFEAGVSIGRLAFGEGHSNHLWMVNNRCLLLASVGSPEAEPATRELLRLSRISLGEKHPNVAVVLTNLAQLLESQGGFEEASKLRAEAREMNTGSS